MQFQMWHIQGRDWCTRMFVHVCLYTYVCTRLFVHICLYTYVCTHVSIVLTLSLAHHINCHTMLSQNTTPMRVTLLVLIDTPPIYVVQPNYKVA